MLLAQRQNEQRKVVPHPGGGHEQWLNGLRKPRRVTHWARQRTITRRRTDDWSVPHRRGGLERDSKKLCHHCDACALCIGRRCFHVFVEGGVVICMRIKKADEGSSEMGFKFKICAWETIKNKLTDKYGYNTTKNGKIYV